MDELSILFAVNAEEMLNNGDISSAVDLCQQGIVKFPDYPLGYYILAKSYLGLFDYSNAKSIADQALSKFPANKLIKNLFDEVSYIQGESEINETVSIESPTEEIINDQLATDEIILESIPDLQETIDQDEQIITDDITADQPLQIEEDESENLSVDITSAEEEISESNDIITEEPAEIVFESAPTVAQHYEQDQENFLKLVVSYESTEDSLNTLKAANPLLIPGLNYTPLRARSKHINDNMDKHIPVFPDFARHFSDELLHHYNRFDNTDNTDEDSDLSYDPSPMIISDTYASILVAQGAYPEALDIYRELIIKFPDKSEQYTQKINELALMT